MKTIALLALVLAAAPLAGAIDSDPNENNGERLNPATSANTIANGGDTDAQAQSVNKVSAPKPAADPGQIAAQRDRALARKVRRALSRDKALGEAARRVDVRARGGKVILRGKVASEDEKIGLAARAAALAGAGSVIDEMTVEPAP
jgi:osmotically-inducible protein OsmY